MKFAESPDPAAFADATPLMGPQWREMVVQIRVAQLSHALRSGQVAKRDAAKILQPRLLW
jgi:hypothetical protein